MNRARRDGAAAIALHTSPLMAIALGHVPANGILFERDAPAIFGVHYGIYVKPL